MFLTPSFQAFVAAVTAQFQNVQSSVLCWCGAGGERRRWGCEWSSKVREAPILILTSPFLFQFRVTGNPPGIRVTEKEEAVMTLGRTQALEAGGVVTLWELSCVILVCGPCRGAEALETTGSRWRCFLEDQLYLILSDRQCCFYIKISTGLYDGI